MTINATRFAEKQDELRGIASQLGRADIFDRDVAESPYDALDGVSWYLDEEFEHIEDEYERDAAYSSSPLVKQYQAIYTYVTA